MLRVIVLLLCFCLPVFGHTVNLAWNPVIQNTGGGSIPSSDITYSVFRGQCLVPYQTTQGAVINASCMTTMPLASIGTTSAPSYSDTTVLAGESYEYYVEALCEDTTSSVCLYLSESGPSNTAVTTVAPSAPSGLNAPLVQ